MHFYVHYVQCIWVIIGFSFNSVHHFNKKFYLAYCNACWDGLVLEETMCNAVKFGKKEILLATVHKRPTIRNEPMMMPKNSA